MELDKRVIVRTYSAGVFFGELTVQSEDGKRGLIAHARRIWKWEGAASLSQLAVEGTSKPHACKFPQTVPSIEVTEVIEVLTVTAKAARSIDSVPEWKE